MASYDEAYDGTNPYNTVGGQRRTIAFGGSQNEPGSVVMNELQSAGLEGG
jgi:hypothetical protein